jgi:hypothetical protein
MAQKNTEEVRGGVEEKNIRLKKLNKFLNDYFNRIVAVTVATVFIFGLIFILIPKYQQTVKLVDSLNQQQTLDVKAKQQELEKINQLIATYSKIDKKYIDKIDSVVPLSENKEELFSELSYLVSVNQLFLNSVSLSTVSLYENSGLLPVDRADKDIIDNLQEVTVSISVKGTNYQSFKNFLSALENNLRLMDVVSIQFDPQGENASLVINVYYYKS